MNLNKSDFKKLLEEYSKQVYICSKCGRIIFPKLEFNNDKISFVTNKGCVSGGLGNKVLKDNICSVCIEASNIMPILKERLNMNYLK
ncbi:uncharacterized protein CBO05P1_002 [Clostridium botulinum B str. Osaka05]|uniref:Uncharacterized protein n=1 Tax=Clostridium botulinum B str. Osaka05 TaxID=1407017 RepID=A0A060N2Y8_CLOBO|nr:hypothetical protein [Clostridium botulinum]BAO04721.1 uncharacterized protein CBO05P1_002 [Clostridium botulinum B str. Osaka05]